MYVTFEHSSALDPELRQLVVQRATRAMHGFALAIRQVHVHLSKSLDLSLSSEKRCWVQLTVGESVIAIGVAQAADWTAAVDKALARAIRTVPEIQRRFRLARRAAKDAVRGRFSVHPSPAFAR